MILVKKTINDKEIYEPISYEDAVEYPNKEDLIFTSEDEKEKFEDLTQNVKEKNETINVLNKTIDKFMKEINGLSHEEKASIEMRLNEIKDELSNLSDLTDENLEEKLESIEEELDEMEDYVDELIDDARESEEKNNNFKKDFGNVFSNVFGVFFNNKKGSSKSNNLIAALPFMDKEDLHELVEQIINNPDEYKELKLVAVFPFLDTADCDTLFIKLVIESKSQNYKIVSLAPFVSKECLSKVVDEYIKGNFQDIDMSMLYPFLDSKDVKRVFKYILSKKD